MMDLAMPRAHFDDLIHALQQRHGVVVETDGDGCCFTLDDVPFRLDLALDLQPPLLGLRCCYGLVPEAGAEAVLIRLLELNLVLALQRDAPALGIDACSGEVMCVLDAPLQQVTGASLCHAVAAAAAQAQGWRRSHLLEDPLADRDASFDGAGAMAV